MPQETLTRVVLGKINFDVSLWAEKDPPALLVGALMGPDRFITTTRADAVSLWLLANTRRLDVNGEILVDGYLTRARDEIVVKISMADMKVETTTVEAALQDQAYFLLDPRAQVLVFQDASPDISPSLFCQNFADICKKVDPDMGSISILPIISSYEDFRREVLSLERIDRAVIRLVRPNPDPDALPTELGELFVREPNAVESSVEMRGAATEGLRPESKMIRSALNGLNRYYSVEFSGRKDGLSASISTSDRALRYRIPHEDTEEARLEAFLAFLQKEKKRLPWR